ncbi:MAG: methylmalonyl-CoA mutase family protein [Thermus sp.]|uniref:acyl-CoA mutase large subunit family protein n=1 Tax=Thermus sp. TaxID=275 RepID=UPI0025FA9904|nr:methylmalonyl-CoA mutase family protein [Thermus sp.]MCS6869349.1 methylmalonyl-CoA mutase family protein [Thermus sp.]MCS7217888.1 methylmalonyl-CoA mutase family protein [Thermus sp.]MCX7850125.1 methylmalonyl-CoA mutase family protein [Thermus sp.]MDW8016491.1 methylmalonyl-CoA mutase family protein [Thermus sp.]MDW8357193.1 methylmalonyl-CoA mutase family protein [Thermus sp.]
MEGLFESLPEGYREKLGRPGEYPFTRGIYPRMYLDRLWTMRQYAGFSTAEESNARYRYLLAQGQTGLSVAFDLPTQLGLDPDHPMSVGEVGRVGVSIATLEDMQKLFQGIPLDRVSTSMTINAPAMMLLALYLLVAEEQGVSWDKVSGTVQNDILKEYFARGTYIYPPGPSMRLVTDIFEFCAQRVPKWNTISISGYHIREAGATAAQEIAFTLADGKAYVRAALERGLDVDAFAPRLSFFFAAHGDILEEAAKFRAARRLWARIMREEFGAKDPRSWALRFHTQTGGSTLTAQEPLNNVVRTAYQALAAVLGGTQSLHTNAYDEALGLPTEKSALLALRTQQILAYESGVTRAIDPLGGSFYVEHLTDQLEAEAERLIREIDALGGAVAAVESGYFSRAIEESAWQFQKEVEEGKRVIVGVNRFADPQSPLNEPTPVQRIDPELHERRKRELAAFKERRDGESVRVGLEALRRAAKGEENLFPYVLEAFRRRATLGEVCGVLREEWGEYQPGR